MPERFLSRLGHWFSPPEMRQAFQTVFRSPAGVNYVLPDLAEFCYASEPAPRDSDLFLQGRFAGRRDVWLHVNEHIHLTEEELTALYKSRSLPQRQER